MIRRTYEVIAYSFYWVQAKLHDNKTTIIRKEKKKISITEANCKLAFNDNNV